MHILKTVQKIPVDIRTAWEFFSSPENLKVITPPGMGFNITTEYREDKMYSGMIITYVVKPFPLIPVKWVTEITHVNEPFYFVDEQRFGPYTFWHHQHKFREVEGGTEAEDIVHYKLPFWFIGKIVNALIVKRQLKKIFDYRSQKMKEMFGSL
jgi:ligand-binding SRPBCC domain-containing protein